MDRKEIVTRHEAQMLKIGVVANAPDPIWVSVYDRDKANTYLTHRFKTIRGKETFYVRMPICPQVSVVEVTGDARISNYEQLPLLRKMDAVDMKNPDIANFIAFAQRFAYNAGTMPTGRYVDDTKQFTISYQPFLREDSGTRSLSPMRIGEVSGIIEVSQEWCIASTVPMRLAILLHEFSHKYMNDDINNETEADLNALLIYLGLGYPRIEAKEAFLQTFLTVPETPYTQRLQQDNKRRYDIIKRFIEDFENHKFVMLNG